jgi:hypothetical protein
MDRRAHHDSHEGWLSRRPEQEGHEGMKGMKKSKS